MWRCPRFCIHSRPINIPFGSIIQLHADSTAAPVASENLPRALSESTVRGGCARCPGRRKNGLRLGSLFSSLSLSTRPAMFVPRHFVLPLTVSFSIYITSTSSSSSSSASPPSSSLSSSSLLLPSSSSPSSSSPPPPLPPPLSPRFFSHGLFLLSGHLSHALHATHAPTHASQEIVPILSFAFSSPRHDLQIAYK